MAQLVIKKLSWWEGNAKQLILWGPIAAVQASTLVGLGYFYQRLSDLEGQGVKLDYPLLLASTLQDVEASSVPRVRRIPPPPPPVAPMPVALQVAVDSTLTRGVMRVGQDFSKNEVMAQTFSTVDSAPMTSSKSVLAVSEPVVKTVKAVERDAERVAQANRSSTLSKLKVNDIQATQKPLILQRMSFSDTPDAVVSIPAEVPRGKPLPVGIVAWVYLGELRSYGWHGQRLHIAPGSGLPVVGEQYRTQKIHGIYDQPYGNRTMGGFQQGDTVSILDVRHEANLGVWAKVRKVRSVGR
ncbi:hypothetical protein SAMN05660964_02713 [Thiothrix caldifontis]|uniref:Uncharacterized protein n=1 Tax=Thiothrix caldifontis TaxID=525918 RepID=A0A1H4EWK2_9GAMM|nr:hypothetical protein [Thiothrix caldifontis]SEA88642.1 hypothetical protein SAMN05660964_02713 [Thiothrix caldifontis]